MQKKIYLIIFIFPLLIQKGLGSHRKIINAIPDRNNQVAMANLTYRQIYFKNLQFFLSNLINQAKLNFAILLCRRLQDARELSVGDSEHSIFMVQNIHASMIIT